MNTTPACPECDSHDVLYISSVIGGVSECWYRCCTCGFVSPPCASAQEADGHVGWVTRAESETYYSVGLQAEMNLVDRTRLVWLIIALACFATVAYLIWSLWLR